MVRFIAVALFASSALAQSINGTANQNIVAPPPYMAGTGTADTVTGCPTPAIGVVTANQTVVRVLPSAANSSTTPTFNLCSLGALTVVKASAGAFAALAASDYTATVPAELLYTGTSWQLLNPQTVSASGALTNITGVVTVSGCTVSSGACVVGSTASSVTFSSIPGTYHNLILRVTAQVSNTGSDVYMQFNGDTAAHYSRQYMFGNITSAGAGQTLSNAQAPISFMSGTSVAAGTATSSSITIYDYARTAWFKNATADELHGSPSGSLSVQATAFHWASTAAITQIVLAPVSATTFAANSVFTLFGEN